MGKRVLDVGAGPGYATVDLAEIVGLSGEVVALERSRNFAHAVEAACRVRSLTNVKVHEIDLMTDDLPTADYDFVWCRWVVSFVSDPGLLIRKLAFFPRLPMHERFREHVIATWRESGGEPDGAARLPELLADNGFVIRSARPHVFCLRPTDYMWQWPATFIETYLPRLIEMGRINQKFADDVRADLVKAEASSNTLMITPLVMEIIAEKL